MSDTSIAWWMKEAFEADCRGNRTVDDQPADSARSSQKAASGGDGKVVVAFGQLPPPPSPTLVTPGQKWLSTKNRSPRRSTPRHPIAIASTAKPPDPIAMCTGIDLVAGVVRARLPYAENRVSRACDHVTWADGGSRIDTLGAGRRCLAPRVDADSWPARDGSQLGVRGRVGACHVGRHCVCPQCGVGHAWTLGLVRRLVALSGLLLRWPSGALGSCCVRRWWITETGERVRKM